MTKRALKIKINRLESKMLKQVFKKGAKQTWMEKQKRNGILKYH